MRKNKIIKTLLLGAIITVTCMGKNVQALTNKHFADSFNSGYLNSYNWTKADGWSNGDMFNCTWKKENVQAANGKTVLLLNKDYSNKYFGGEVRSNDTFGYGLYQVNMKPAKNIGIVSSFFTYTGPSDNTPWDEIDIEFLGKDTTKVQFNYYTNGVGNHEYVYNLGFDAAYSFHTYAFNWQPNYIAWLVDGKEVYRAYNNIPSHPGKIMMNLWNGIGVDSWLGKFNGATNLKAEYDWVSYDPIR